MYNQPSEKDYIIAPHDMQSSILKLLHDNNTYYIKCDFKTPELTLFDVCFGYKPREGFNLMGYFYCYFDIDMINSSDLMFIQWEQKINSEENRLVLYEWI